MQTTRRYKRYKTDVMEMSGKVVLAKSLKILDISIDGICLKAEKRFDIGGEYTLKMKGEGKGKTLTLKGIVAWALLSETSVNSYGNVVPIYKTGMKFVDVSKEKINEIVNFMEKHKRDIEKLIDLYGTSGRRLHVRISIEDPQKAVLSYLGSYKVKIISLGGMLIESEHPLEIESRYRMEIRTLTENSYIKFLGRVASCLLIKDNGIEHYGIGIEFIEMLQKDRKILVELIDILDCFRQ
jgi:Tfp pilus assembly protein PilZ